MELMRNVITPEELLSVKPNKFERAVFYWNDPVPGDCFFIKGEPDKVYYLEGTVDSNEDDKWKYKYCGGKLIDYDECMPLYNVSQLLHLLNIGHAIELRNFGERWILILDRFGRRVYRSRRGQDLVGFIWRVCKELIEGEGLI